LRHEVEGMTLLVELLHHKPLTMNH
jgi:hypothetical protein